MTEQSAEAATAPARRAAPTKAATVQKLLSRPYLAPDITAAILDGRQPAHLNRQLLARIDNLPIDWLGQRAMLGFG
jgi:hypothetical protein